MKNEIVSFAGKYVWLEIITVNEIRQFHKYKHGISSGRETGGEGERRETEEHDTPARNRHHEAPSFAQLMSRF